MGIVVACRCGQALEADLDLAGKVVQCPVCRNPIVVPTPRSPVAAPQPWDDFDANQALTEETGFRYRPRSVPPASRESRESTESMGTILVAGVVIFLVVLFLSVGIVGYIRWKDVVAHQASPLPPTPSASTVAPSGPAVAATPTPAQPTAADSARGNLAIPEDWISYSHPTAGYSVILPTAPEVLERTVENVGVNRIFHILRATQGEHAYEACREFRSYRIAAGDEGQTYDAAIKKRADEIDGGVVRSETITLEGRTIRDVTLKGTMDGAEVRQYLRLVALGDSLLELSCRVPQGKERGDDIAAFLSGYKID